MLLSLLNLSKEKVEAIKRNFMLYTIFGLIGVIVYQNNQLTKAHSQNEALYNRISVKDSTINANNQVIISYYQNFFVETSKLLVMQKAQINKADTIITKLSGTSRY